jgi:ABC-type sugar transport system permease subunit
LTGAPRRRRRLHRRIRAFEALLWLAPALAVIAFVFGYGIYRLLYEALHRDGAYVGLGNLHIVFQDPLFRGAVQHNLTLIAFGLPIIIVIALLLSILLYEGMAGWRFHRGVVFIPYLLPVAVVGVLFGQILTLHGLLNSSLDEIGLGSLTRDWLGDPDYALSSLIGVIVWKELGFGVIIFLARLFALPPEVYEAARADGAGWWRTHWHVSLPGLRPIILFYLVIEGITLLSWVFNYVFVMTGGGPGEATGVIETYVYDNLITYRLGWLAASAASVVLATVAALAAGVLITRRIVGSRAA